MTRTSARLSERAERALEHAGELALLEGQEEIGANHLATALLAQTQGVAAKSLENAGTNPRKLFPDLPEPPEYVPDKDAKSMELGEETKEIVELAVARAHDMRHTHTGTEHLLMGVLAHGRSEKARTLIRAGMDEQAFREAVNHLLGGGHQNPNLRGRLEQAKGTARETLARMETPGLGAEAQAEIAKNALQWILEL